MIRVVAAEGHYPLNQRVENFADLQKSPSVSAALFAVVCDWIATLGIGQVSRRDWSPRFGLEINRYVGDINVASLEATEGEEISILENGTMTWFSPPNRRDSKPPRPKDGVGAATAHHRKSLYHSGK